MTLRRLTILDIIALACLAIGGLVLVSQRDPLPQRVDAWLVDFNYPEQTGEQSFSRAQSSAFVPDVPLVRTRLVMRAQSPAPLPPRPLTIGYNGHDMATTVVGAQPRVLNLLLPSAREVQTDGMAINLRTTATQSGVDQRQLGLLFNTVYVQPLLTIEPPAPRQLPRVLGVVLILAVALFVVTQPWRYVRAESDSAIITALQWREAWPLGALVFLCVGYAGLMSYFSIAKHTLFHTNIYDLGQYNQALWLISRGLYPYSTAQGVHILGNHAAFLLYPLALLYWITPDVRALLVLQSVVIALGAIPLFLIGRARGNAVLGLAAGVAYLLHPATQNMNLFDFHPDALAATALLFALWAAEERRWWTLVGCCAVVLAAKENFSLTIACLGLWLALKQRAWWRGGLICAVGIAWFFFTTQVVLPYFNDQGHSLHLLERYAQYGNSVPAIAATFLRHPSLLLAPLIQPDSLTYMWMLIAPFALLCLLSPQYLVLALPALVLNLLSSSVAQRSIVFHYNALIVAVAAVATLETLLLIDERAARNEERGAKIKVRRIVLAGALLWLAAGVGYSQMTIELRVSEVRGWLAAPSARLRYYDYLLSFIPPGANIAAQTTIQPHLAQRTQAFLFPNPFQRVAFVDPQQMPYTASVEYIMFDTRRTDSLFSPSGAQLDLLRALQERKLYTPLARLDGIVLLRRSDASLPPDCFGTRWEAAECSP